MWRIERRPWSDGFTRLMAGAMQAASTIVSRLKSQNDRKEQSRTQAPPDDSPIGASVTIGLRDRTLDHKIRPDTLHDLATDDDFGIARCTGTGISLCDSDSRCDP